MNNLAPCKDCAERRYKCHAVCALYQNFKVEREKARKVERDETFSRNVSYESMMAAYKRGHRR